MKQQVTRRLPVPQLFALILAWLLVSCSQPQGSPATPDKGSPPAQDERVRDNAPATEIPIGKVVDWESEVDNPTIDGWDSEVSAAAAKKQLDQFGMRLGLAAKPDPDVFAPLAVTPIERSSFTRSWRKYSIAS